MRKFEKIYMDLAVSAASMSKCVRKKVGAVAVKDLNVIAFGFNGTPSGWHTNTCENAEGKTTDYVLHAEENLIAKVARQYTSLEGADIYITYAPCMRCSRLLYQSGIRSVTWLEDNKYGGREMLEELGISCRKYNPELKGEIDV